MALLTPPRRVVLSACGLLAVMALVYHPVLAGQLLAGREVFRIFFPDSAFLLESLRAGELPLWTPYLRLGQPFAATLYSQVFYPPRWLAVLLAGPIAGMTVLHLFHVALAAVGVFLLARQLRVSWPAAMVAGATFGLCPMMTTLSIQQNVVDAAAWSGFILHAARTTALAPSAANVARLTALTALSVLAGSPETTLWQGLLCLLSLPRPRLPGRYVARAVPVALGLALAGAVAAVALLPAAEFAMNSLRMDAEAFAKQRLTWSTSWPQLLSAVWPLADWPRDTYWGQDQWFILNQFLGALPCALGFVGAVWGPRRARPLAVGALLLALLSLGRHFPPATWALQIPPFSLFRYPSKYFVGAAFCLSVLSGFGLDALGRFARRVGASRLKAALAFVGMGVALAISGPVVRRLPLREMAQNGVIWPLLFWGLAAVIFLLLPSTFGRPRRVRHAVAVLTVLELVAAHQFLGLPKHAPFRSLDHASALRPYLPQPFEGRVSAGIMEPEATAQVGVIIERSIDWLVPNRFVEEHLPALEGYGAPEPAYSELLQYARERSVYDLTGVTLYIRRGPPPFADLELLHQLEDGVTLSRSRTALPRAFLVQQARVVHDEEALAAVRAPSQPFRRTAFLATGEPLDRPACDGQARIVDSGAQHLEVEAEACDESYLVLSDTHYPGWKATLDGAPVPIHRANYALRAVRTPTGTHRIRFEYHPWSFRLGLAVSLLTCGGLAALILYRRRIASRPRG
ncbi:YfhO family protein [Hyalangium rubrum]|uniref:YfhO family protein n=1 Tax=Hyalangium rubrum TaxID=3103134 RepID=A0ABU5HAS0_9BACT|nr:YfhO family protein [Hyalangium sp. s54d21]MDY7230570.1 YfhO family protein [Hyalangium sp. s54d21]